MLIGCLPQNQDPIGQGGSLSLIGSHRTSMALRDAHSQLPYLPMTHLLGRGSHYTTHMHWRCALWVIILKAIYNTGIVNYVVPQGATHDIAPDRIWKYTLTNIATYIPIDLATYSYRFGDISSSRFGNILLWFSLQF